MSRLPPAALLQTARAARLAVLLILVVSLGCAGKSANPADLIRVQSEQSPTASFYRYKTYCWVWEPTPDPGTRRTQEDLRDWRVRNAIDAQLADRGYAKVPQRKADFLVDYHTERKQRTISTFSDYLKYRDYGGTGEISEIYVVGYEEAVLIVELFDGQSKQLAWRASATSVVNPGDQQDHLTSAVRRMFARFPAQ
jgi:hypothetical protein